MNRIILTPIHPLRKLATPDECRIIDSIVSNVASQNFDEKPNIPSYFVFNLLNTLAQLLEKTIEPIEELCKTFSRDVDLLINSFKRLEEDLAANERSDKTAPNTVQYIAALKYMIQSLQAHFANIKKEDYDRTADIVKCGKDILAVLNGVVSEKKDAEIFAFVESEPLR
jgi:hypothetical protein